MTHLFETARQCAQAHQKAYTINDLIRHGVGMDGHYDRAVCRHRLCKSQAEFFTRAGGTEYEMIVWTQFLRNSEY